MRQRHRHCLIFLSAAWVMFTGFGCSGGAGSRSSDIATADGKPSELPTLASLNLYSSDSVFNTKLRGSESVDPASATMVQSLVRAGNFIVQFRQFSSPVFFADASTPRHDLTVHCGPAWEIGVTKLKGVPIPKWAEASEDKSGATPPSGCGENSEQDNNMVILDLTTRCEYSLWQARKENGAWVASWSNRTTMGGNGIFQKGLSTRASGFSFLAGVIWPDELKEGVIHHKLVFSYPYTKAPNPVAPAVSTDGLTTDADAIPIGAIIQLDPSLDLDALGITGAEKTIAKAMQEYGIILSDSGGTSGIGLYAVDPKSVTTYPYEGIFPSTESFIILSKIPVDKLRVLKLGVEDTDFKSMIQLEAAHTCGNFE